MSAQTQSFQPPRFDPVFSLDQINQAEKNREQRKEWVIRRTMLATLTKSSEDLIKALDNDESAEAFLAVLEDLTEYEKDLEALKECARAASARLISVLTHLHPESMDD